MSKYFGKCALCGKKEKLTFEHIPPRAAFNSTPAKPVSSVEMLKKRNDNKERMPWDTDGLRYQNQQQGMGRYSLCHTCNNNTGSWYGDAYIYFANVAHDAICNCSDSDANGITFQGVYPLRFVKQVLSMFCSICDPGAPALEPIRKFVLDKDAVGLDKSKYKLCMYFTNSTIYKQTGYIVSMKSTSAGMEMMALSEITAYPFGFILYFDPTESWHYHGIDITPLVDYGYNDICDISMLWKVEEMNDIIPESYRSKDQIKQCIKNNMERCENETRQKFT
jgi:hypothetical protein